LFCLISAEAVLLTGKEKYDRCKTHRINVKSKAGKGLTKKRAGSMAGMPV